ncbi:5609_t:CDS:1, partial [Dentiscutata heterogama]
DKYSYRSDRMYLVGHSIGAFLSAQLVFIPEYLINAASSYLKNTERIEELFNSIRGVVGIEGVYDIPSLVESWPDYKSKKYIEPAYGTDPEVYKSASPEYHSIKDAITIPSFLIIHSFEDEDVDIGQAYNFYEYVKQGCESCVEIETGIKGTHNSILKEKELELRVEEFILLQEAKLTYST